MKNITIEDVAIQAGVSITTVSRVMNNNYPVSQKTREKVEKVIDELNFIPNILARGLIQKKTYTIGVLVPSITNLFFPVVINGIQVYFSENGYQILMCDTNGDPDNEAKYLKQLMERQVDGIISIDPRTVNVKSGLYCNASSKIPIILVNGYHHDIKLNYVINDQKGGTVEAIEYLICLGHKNIGFLRGGNSFSYDLKEEVYRELLKKHNIAFHEDLLISVADGNSINTLDMATIAAMKILESKNRPTAIFTCNDWMAVGVLNAANALHIKVPDELSIIGYDNIAISEITMPKLTTVDQNMSLLGETAAKQLLNIITGYTEGYTKTFLDTKLVIRDSCSKIS